MFMTLVEPVCWRDVFVDEADRIEIVPHEPNSRAVFRVEIFIAIKGRQLRLRFWRHNPFRSRSVAFRFGFTKHYCRGPSTGERCEKDDGKCSQAERRKREKRMLWEDETFTLRVAPSGSRPVRSSPRLLTRGTSAPRSLDLRTAKVAWANDAASAVAN